MNKTEKRFFNLTELRFSGEKNNILDGYAALFDSSTTIRSWFGEYKEVIRSGAFNKTLADKADVRALFNHNPDFILGRTKSDTLKLSVDKKGLRFNIDLPDTQQAKDLKTLIDRGDISQCSFAFEVIKDKWSEEKAKDNDGNEFTVEVRELLEVKLYDISAVTYPAYEDTNVFLRFKNKDIDEAELMKILIKNDRGIELNETEFKYIENFRNIINKIENSNNNSIEEVSNSENSTSILRKKLELLEIELNI